MRLIIRFISIVIYIFMGENVSQPCDNVATLQHSPRAKRWRLSVACGRSTFRFACGTSSPLTPMPPRRWNRRTGFETGKDSWVVATQTFLEFSPLITWGNDPIWLYNIFQRGWFNHQLDRRSSLVNKHGWLEITKCSRCDNYKVTFFLTINVGHLGGQSYAIMGFTCIKIHG